jgi:hypothetical protein
LVVHLAGHNFEKLLKLLGYFDDTPQGGIASTLSTAVGTTRKAVEMLDYSLLGACPALAALDGDTALHDQCRKPATPQYEEWTKAGLDLELVGVNCGRQMFVTDAKWQTNP